MEHDLKGWVPSQLRQEEDRLLCRWTYTAEAPYKEPFFEETLQRCLGLPENTERHRVATSLDLLPGFAAEIPALEPAAFIFHVSRCGSTLVTQLLGEDPAFVTLSETPFFDQLLRARFNPELGVLSPRSACSRQRCGCMGRYASAASAISSSRPIAGTWASTRSCGRSIRKRPSSCSTAGRKR